MFFLILWSVISAVGADLVTNKAVNFGGGISPDGSYSFGYKNYDEGLGYHDAHGEGLTKIVHGRFGSRDSASKYVKETEYSAGPNGFRARGPNIHRKMDLSQVPIPEHFEDPSYSYKYNAVTSAKEESADSRGDVRGHYWYLDDVGERHDVDYVAGKGKGFHVKTPYPDSGSATLGYFSRPLVRAGKLSRGRSSVQRGSDGSYRFISAGPDQRRTESSDAFGNVKGSYTFLDDKGIQRSVHYIAGPGIGYRVIDSSNVPYIPPYFPPLPEPFVFDDSPLSVAAKGDPPQKVIKTAKPIVVSNEPVINEDDYVDLPITAKGRFYDDYALPSRVRAHVQNIDLYPYGTKTITPGEAMSLKAF